MSGAKPVDGAPMVRVLDESGEEIIRGWYIRHENRQPYCLHDELHEDDVDHIVAVDGFADWGMPRELRLIAVTPPHRIEVVSE